MVCTHDSAIPRLRVAGSPSPCGRRTGLDGWPRDRPRFRIWRQEPEVQAKIRSGLNHRGALRHRNRAPGAPYPRIPEDQGTSVMAHVASGPGRCRGGAPRHGDRELRRPRNGLFATECPRLHPAGPEWLLRTERPRARRPHRRQGPSVADHDLCLRELAADIPARNISGSAARCRYCSAQRQYQRAIGRVHRSPSRAVSGTSAGRTSARRPRRQVRLFRSSCSRRAEAQGRTLRSAVRRHRAIR